MDRTWTAPDLPATSLCRAPAWLLPWPQALARSCSAKNSALAPAQVKNALESTATDKGTDGFDNIYGYWLINASAAINSITLIKLVFITAAQAITTGSASNVITILTQDATNNNPFNVTGTITINLISTSGTGRFDTSASGPFNGSLTSVTIASGSNYTSFYYKDTTTGTPTITAASAGLTSGTQQETVNPAPTSVPTISRWGVVGMIIALAGCIIWMLRRRTACNLHNPWVKILTCHCERSEAIPRIMKGLPRRLRSSQNIQKGIAGKIDSTNSGTGVSPVRIGQRPVPLSWASWTCIHGLWNLWNLRGIDKDNKVWFNLVTFWLRVSNV